MANFMQDQARDDHGRWTSGGVGPSQRRGEIVALNRQLDMRRKSHLFGPAAKAVMGQQTIGGGGGGQGGGGRMIGDAPAHMTGIYAATKHKRLSGGPTLAEVSAMGATRAQVKGGQ